MYLGFMCSNVCLLYYESDFRATNKKGLLPRLGEDSLILFITWKQLAGHVFRLFEKVRFNI